MTTDMEDQPINTVLDRIKDDTDGDQVNLEELMEVLGTRSYGPLLLMMAILAVSPVGAIPGMSIITAAIVILLAGQMLIGRKSPWLPRRLLEKGVPRKRITKAVEQFRPWVGWADQLVSKRLAVFNLPSANKVTAVLCILLACLFFPLAFVPFGVAIPGTVLGVMALGLMAKDGVVLLLGHLLFVGALGAAWYFLF